MTSSSRMSGGGGKTCWNNGHAVMDEFRSYNRGIFRRRAEDMDAFGLALHNILRYVNGPLRKSIEKANGGSMPEEIKEECFACLPVEYAKGIESQNTGRSTSTVDALVLDMLSKEVFPKLPYQETCEIRPVEPALSANAI